METVMQIKITDRDKDTIRAAAEAVGLSLSAFVRLAALEKAKGNK